MQPGEMQHLRPRSSPVAWRAALAALILAACAASSSDDAPDRSECERYRDHAIDRRLASTQGPPMPAGTLEAHRRQLTDAVGPALVDQCEHRFSRARYACSLAATSHDQLAACASN